MIKLLKSGGGHDPSHQGGKRLARLNGYMVELLVDRHLPLPEDVSDECIYLFFSSLLVHVCIY